jgi:Ras and EF-hand domain-containing protein
MADIKHGDELGGNMQHLIAAKAEELFNLCDTEQKGFIIKKDMQRLRDELGVEPEQLEDVFDSLDGDHNGYLTLEEFTGEMIFFLLISYLIYVVVFQLVLECFLVIKWVLDMAMNKK